MIPTQIQGQVPINYQAMMMQMAPPAQAGYMPMAMPGMMVPQVRPPIGVYPQNPMYPGAI